MNLANLKDFPGVAIKLKESIFKKTTISNPLLQPEHGFCQQNRPEHGQLQDWYPDEKMVVVHVFFNGRCCCSEC